MNLPVLSASGTRHWSTKTPSALVSSQFSGPVHSGDLSSDVHRSDQRWIRCIGLLECCKIVPHCKSGTVLQSWSRSSDRLRWCPAEVSRVMFLLALPNLDRGHGILASASCLLLDILLVVGGGGGHLG